VGHGIDVDEIIIDERGNKFRSGDPAFIAYYGSAGRVVAVASLNADPVVAEVAQLMNDKVELTISEIIHAAQEGKSAEVVTKKLAQCRK